MSLFRTFPNPADFSPLFRLLDDYDVHRSAKGGHQTTTTSVRSFAPRFDVRETSDAYHLDGDVPGAAQKDIDIEFSDPQTLVIKGRTEREYHSDNSSDEHSQHSDSESECETTHDVAAKATSEKQATKRAAEHATKPHYWVSERSVGEFQRTFSFPARVDQEGVKANLKNGVLSVVVPKAAAPTVKKITIE